MLGDSAAQNLGDIARKLRDAHTPYTRIPHPDLGDLIIFDAAQFDPGTPDGCARIKTEHMDGALGESFWERAIKTPGKRRTSGNLGKLMPAVGDEAETVDSVEIRVQTPQVIAIAADGHTLSEAANAAILATKDLDPGFDVEELEKVLRDDARSMDQDPRGGSEEPSDPA